MGAAVIFAHTHKFMQPYTHTRTHTSSSMYRTVRILHTPLTWMQFRKMEKDLILTIHPEDKENINITFGIKTGWENQIFHTEIKRLMM